MKNVAFSAEPDVRRFRSNVLTGTHWMSDFLQVMLLALFPAVGNFLGGMLAEVTRTAHKTLSLALHLSAGVLFRVIAIELAPRAFEGRCPWLVGLGLALAQVTAWAGGFKRSTIGLDPYPFRTLIASTAPSTALRMGE